MTELRKAAVVSLPVMLLAALWCAPARSQDPVTAVAAPMVIDTAAPIIVRAIKPKPSGLSKFEGTVMNANIAQITVRAKGNDMSVQTFTLSQQASTKMQQIVDKGGYHYGDKVTVMYDPTSLKAVKVKGKPSRPL
jgi:hypothetical protein